MPDITLEPLAAPAPQTTTDQVFETLYSAVVSLKLPPGAKVSEAEIAKQLDVSRQPVRDAFFRLSKLGFLLIRPQRATLVSRISERAVLNAAFVRTAIEAECTRLATERRTDEDIARLRANLQRQEQALGVEDAGVFHGLDDAFHRMICTIAGHAHAWDLIQEQKAQMDRVRFLTLSEKRRRDVRAEHGVIVDAIASGDPDEAERLMRTHLADIRRVVSQIRHDKAAFFEEERP
ncbi:GntR family transcriptional regulator [Citreimonas sp.]|uniref:GntR family transcriptional regulator n=1 Tax=Citreimonas sp. TaxID=3036715 RepID=UPI0035C7930B